MGDIFTIIPPSVIVSVIAALAAIISTAMNLNAMRKPRPSTEESAVDLTDSATGLIGRLETRMDKMEIRYGKLEKQHEELEADYRRLEEAFKECLEGSLRNISQLKEHKITPIYEPKFTRIYGRNPDDA